jgi:uncharacterized NAD(P)/FAD-binding protein YdhS
LSRLHVAIIGGGYSGTLQAIQLLRRGATVTLVERAKRVGRGIAYSTPHDDHLLNVAARRMSAFPDEPSHFSDWLAKRGLSGSEDFVQRKLYGAYLEELIGVASAEAGDRLQIVDGEAVDAVSSGGGEIICLADGTRIGADEAILALGNLEPDVAPGIAPELRAEGIYVANPWASDIAAGIGDADTVLLIGTGLTAIDAALILDSSGFRGRILAISRRGLVPRAHSAAAGHPAGLEAVPDLALSQLVRFVRKEADRLGWREAVEQLRPVTQPLWARSSPEQRRRFLRHLRPWWDVHRHRIAPSIANRISGMERAGRLSFRSGKIVSMSPVTGGAAVVEWRTRGSERIERLETARIVNCTGPQLDISRAGEPLLDRLLETGRIRPDVCRIGIDVDAEGRVLDHCGQASPSLYSVGPMTRGALWEIVAVPDIRGQVKMLADRLIPAD